LKFLSQSFGVERKCRQLTYLLLGTALVIRTKVIWRYRVAHESANTTGFPRITSVPVLLSITISKQVSNTRKKDKGKKNGGRKENIERKERWKGKRRGEDW
jgi:hypothetical protein